MLRQTNRYCSTCLRTRKFVNLEDRLVCQFCGKRLWRKPAADHRPSRRSEKNGKRSHGAVVRQLHFDAVV